MNNKFGFEVKNHSRKQFMCLIGAPFWDFLHQFRSNICSIDALPFKKLVFLLFVCICFKPCLAQRAKTGILQKKFSPLQLKRDAQIMEAAILKMHPGIGIYNSRKYYVALFDSLNQTLTDSLTERQFRIKLRIVLDQLHCGHTEALPAVKYVKAFEKDRPGISPYIFMPLHDKVYVLASINKRKDTLLKKGTEIVRIDGVSTDSMINLCKKIITTDGYNQSGKEHYLKMGFNRYYPALFGSPDTFRVEYKKGKELKMVKYPAEKIKKFAPISLTNRDDSMFIVHKRANLRFKYLDTAKKSLYLRLSSFSRKGYGHAYKKIFKILKKNNSENLIVDLRYNGGGSLENSYLFLSYLLDSSHTQTLKTGIRKYPERRYTKGNIWFKFMRFGLRFITKKTTINDTDYYVHTIKPHIKNHFNGKIYVLINGGSFSASCLVSAYLKYNHRAVFIGEETSGAIEGCNAGITPYYKLPNTRIKIRVPAFRIINDVSPQITGHGIYPDYKIEYTIKDVLMKKDLELNKVKELLR